MMRRDDVLAEARKKEPSWEEVRAQRVLGRLLDQVGRERERGRRSTAAWRVSMVAAAAIVAIVSVAALVRRGHRPEPGGEVAELANAKPVHLADGSELLLDAAAQMDVVEEQRQAVRVLQRGGRIDYRVTHDIARAFVVQAGDVRVTVRGTRFSVTMQDDTVEVKVTAGKVEVDDGQRPTVLVAGEAVRLRAWTASRPAEVHEAPSDPALGAAPEPVVSPPKAERAPRKSDERATNAGDPVDLLFDEVAQARAQGELGAAASKLRELTHKFPRDPRVASAEFTLGRVERARGRHRQAAEAFARCAAFAPKGTLAEEALSEEASSWLADGDRSQAAAAARRYLSLYPRGGRADRMRSILE
jgi:transmembrane sensor